MFYFPPSEREEIARKKKRRRMEVGREERLRALAVEAEEGGEKEEEEEGTEPSSTQLLLMHKLHLTLLTSPDPSLLEIRILANHGTDPRFSFLRKGGKWSDVWEGIRRGEDKAAEEVREGRRWVLGEGRVGGVWE
ncbi:hypothetical protein BCR35DRAFT_334818 [Leucosporidium creatinivorum]|uniref:Uncharacterized protein n=1 Tax=Leucosporidium creatinivorum TaxID=106004 RepID=A0A1Y2DUM9_9BASI|nr:hypothetical protein BCR35DRAFT_334818 [Leucosporidium creatinivorum]